MRPNILEKLPALTSGRVVLIAGPPNMHGINKVKELVQVLNRDEEWIRAEFRDVVSPTKVTSNVGMVLTMYGMGHSTLHNLRQASKGLGIHCPNEALTASEIKTVLGHLAQSRPGKTGLNGNGNGKHTPAKESAEGKKPVEKLTEQSLSWPPLLPEAKAAAQEAQPEKAQPENKETKPADADSVTSATESVVGSGSDDAESAFMALEKFRAGLDEVGVAVLTIGDALRLKDRSARVLQNTVKKLEEKLESLTAQENEKAELQSQVSQLETEILTARASNARLVEKNKDLEEENAKLRKTLDGLDSLIKGVRGGAKK